MFRKCRMNGIVHKLATNLNFICLDQQFFISVIKCFIATVLGIFITSLIICLRVVYFKRTSDLRCFPICHTRLFMKHE